MSTTKCHYCGTPIFFDQSSKDGIHLECAEQWRIDEEEAAEYPDNSPSWEEIIDMTLGSAALNRAMGWES